MYGICGARSDGKVLNCPVGSPSVKPNDLLSAKIQSLCPTITGNVCCSEQQFDILRSQVQQAIPFLVGCPACLRNFLNLFCELSCSPNQSQFINVSSISTVGKNQTVDGIEYYVTDDFGRGLFDSCKEVKFGTLNSRVIDFVGAGASDFRGLFAFLGRKVGPGIPGSPFSISFVPNAPESSGIVPMNVSSYSCGDTSLGCSCGDCPSAFACSNSALPPPTKRSSCSVRIGSLKAKCIDFSLTIVYIVLVSSFLGWGFFHKRNEPPRSSGERALVNTATAGVVPDINDNKDDDGVPVRTLESATQANGGIKLSVVQGYMSKFYRRYGTLVARHPAIVLFLSVGVVLLLCVGLIRFKVETRPEKLWVAPGSKAAKEKLFFDSHLAPFYRIEQLVIATVPDTVHGKSPSIVTDSNINLLFDIQRKVDAIRASYGSIAVSLSDICFKPLGNDCATQSVLQYFKMDPQNYATFGGLDHVNYCFQHYTSSESCASTFKAPVDPSTALGGYAGNNYSEATAFVVTYLVNNEADKEGNYTKRAIAWERAFVQLAKDEISPLVRSGNLTVTFSTESSIEDELKRESTADVITILISYVVMFAYISLTLGNARLSSLFISSKVLLGLSGVLLVLLSVLGSAGFYSAIGVKSTLIIMEVIPFLVLAVGVDNMCILVHAVKRQPIELPIEGRVSNALVEVGPSITLASLSEVLAFAVGSFVAMPACRVFSMFAALAVLLDFVLQVTAFVALIVFDFRRAASNRVDCLPCIKLSSHSIDSTEGPHQQTPGILSRYMKEIHAPVLSIWGVKLVVVCIFVGFSLACI
ncbi:hypothetical protein M569_01615, partial [Genlisea aurea]